MATATGSPARHIGVRSDWLTLNREAALEPELPIIDTHHHLWERPPPMGRYLLHELAVEIAESGHNIRATVLVQSGGSMYRADGDRDFAPVGEVEFTNGVAAMSASGAYGKARICAGIVGYADLAIGARVKAVLEAQMRASPERFRGIRYSLTWDADPMLHSRTGAMKDGVMREAKFREGFACLGELGLVFDAWVYQTQLAELADLAGAFPVTSFVVNHLGGPLHIGPYAGKRDDMFAQWKKSIEALAQRPNVCMKLGGIGMNYGGFGFHEMPAPPSSADMAKAWTPYIDTCIAAFGTRRCMFESNFPVDKGSASYTTIWNALKRLAKGASAAEKTDLFSLTAARWYRLAV